MATEWTEELENEVIEKYQAANPTPENTSEVVKQIADELDLTPNGVRMKLVKADVYIKKAAPASGGSSGGGGGKRVNKQEAQDNLTSKIESFGLEADEEIISRLTGKAAVYFSEVLEKING